MRSCYKPMLVVVRCNGPTLPSTQPMQVMIATQPGSIDVSLGLHRFRIWGSHPLKGFMSWRRIQLRRK